MSGAMGAALDYLAKLYAQSDAKAIDSMFLSSDLVFVH